MNPLIQLKTTPLLLTTLALLCFGLSPTAKALLPPPAPDGGYPGANTAEGTDALFSLSSGIANTAVGLNALHDNTTGGWNVAIGSSALASNTTGSFNMAVGTDALTKSTANYNLAIGFRVGFMNTTGNHLTGIGAGALFSNTTASFVTAIGSDALHDNTTGEDNTAIGAEALSDNTTGTLNTAVGTEALVHNTTGNGNMAIGWNALFSNTTAVANTAVGAEALASNTTGIANTAIGNSALDNSTTGSFNIVVGQSGASIISASNVICIGSDGANVSNTTWIGNIYGVTPQSGTTAPVVVSLDGQLGTVVSSERFKKDISTMHNASEAILSLRPVTFHYKSDVKDFPQFGLIAEEVAKVNPALVLLDKEGKPYTVRYDAVNAMLLNEFLKEHRKVENLEATVAQQHKDFEAAVAELKGQIQKVSAQLEASKPAPQVVNNNR
jgi:hypothetical protein